MQRVTYVDSKGRKWVKEVPLGTPEELYRAGAPVGPPALDCTELQASFEEFEVRLHNELYNRSILTWQDFQRKSDQVIAALQAAYRVDRQLLERLYFQTRGG